MSNVTSHKSNARLIGCILFVIAGAQMAAGQTMRLVADGTLTFIRGRGLSNSQASARAPHQACLRGVKQGFSFGGVLSRYPAWASARKMPVILHSQKQLRRFVNPGFKFVQLKKMSAALAPAYAVLVYGGGRHGHIEIKVPAAHLIERGFTYALESVNGRTVQVPLRELEFVYISDYIDAFPRNHPRSRTANRFPNNDRPLVAVFELREDAAKRPPLLLANQ